MICYALYHPATGNYMPAKLFKQAASGYSYWEPTNSHGMGGIGKLPRLFETLHAACMAKYYWETGPYKRHMQTESEGWDMPTYEYQSGVIKDTTEQILPRNKGDLVIVTVELKEIK